MFFDGKHLRVREFISPASIIYHPLLKSQIMLGTMDCKHEDTNYVKRFWRIFSSAYKEANWTIEKFNPGVGVVTWQMQISIGLKRFTEKMKLNV